MERFTRGGLLFDVTDSGPADGTPIVLLHGFPQDRTAWDQVTPLLADAGLRTLAPDQRGYSPGARPRDTAAYRMPELVGDVTALLDAAGLERAHIVGHDWGGAVAWAMAESLPQRVETLTVLSTPHPTAMAWAMAHGSQARDSWYMAAFQVPALPEVVLERAFLQTMGRTGMRSADAARYAARFREPGMARGALGWYRAMPATRSMKAAALTRLGRKGSGASMDGAPVRNARTVTVPTTYVWGSRDSALGRTAAERSAHHVSGDYRFVEVDANHWLPEREPQTVAREIIDRVSGKASA
ncbi:MAG: alpha/beta hydrolase [Micrococcales bacterium]|nr:alpha/beta hydrolase [Micrococcales bacterium]